MNADLHERQHALLAERRAAWQETPAGRGNSLKREAAKRYWTNLRGHLQQMHGHRIAGAYQFKVEEAEKLHKELHEEES